MEIESYMYEYKREVKVLETGDRKGQHRRRVAKQKRRVASSPSSHSSIPLKPGSSGHHIPIVPPPSHIIPSL